MGTKAVGGCGWFRNEGTGSNVACAQARWATKKCVLGECKRSTETPWAVGLGG